MRPQDKHKDDPYLAPLLQRLQRNVRYLRRKLNLTAQEAAERADMDWRQWQRVEAGESNATLVTLTRLANGLGVSLSELLGPELPPARGKPTTKRRRRARKRG